MSCFLEAGDFVGAPSLLEAEPDGLEADIARPDMGLLKPGVDGLLEIGGIGGVTCLLRAAPSGAPAAALVMDRRVLLGGGIDTGFACLGGCSLTGPTSLCTLWID